MEERQQLLDSIVKNPVVYGGLGLALGLLLGRYLLQSTPDPVKQNTPEQTHKDAESELSVKQDEGLEKQLEEARSQIAELEEKIKGLEENDTSAEKLSLEQRLEEKEREMKAAKDAMAKHELEKSSFERDKLLLEQKITDKKLEIAKLNQGEVAAKLDKKHLTEELTQLKESMQTKVLEATKASEEIKTLIEAKASLERQLATATSQVDTLSQTISGLQEQLVQTKNGKTHSAPNGIADRPMLSMSRIEALNQEEINKIRNSTIVKRSLMSESRWEAICLMARYLSSVHPSAHDEVDSKSLIECTKNLGSQKSGHPSDLASALNEVLESLAKVECHAHRQALFESLKAELKVLADKPLSQGEENALENASLQKALCLLFGKKAFGVEALETHFRGEFERLKNSEVRQDVVVGAVEGIKF